MSEREKFEAWAKRDGFGLERNHFGDYERIATRGAWDAWQAALATPQQAVPEGWKLVPINPTEEMMTAMSRGAGCEGYIEIGYRMMLAASPTDQVDTRIGEMVCGDVESTLDGYEVGDYELIYGKELDEINVNHPGKVFAIYIDRAAMSVSKEGA